MFLLGRVALLVQRPLVVKLSHGRSVGLSVRTYVHRSLCPVHCGKTADRIRMPFGIIGRTGPHCRDKRCQMGTKRDEARSGVWDRSTGMGTFGGELGARHCNQWGTLQRTYATAPRRGPLPKLLWADFFSLY